MTAAIVTITLNPALDITTATDALVPRKKLRCAAPRYEPGGGGVNVSRAISALGGNSLAFVLLGGATGEQYRDLLAQSGIRYKSWTGAGETRASVTVMETKTRDHYRFVFPGPEQPAHSGDALLEGIIAAIGSECRFVVGSGSLPPGLPDDIYRRIGTFCRTTGRSFILDTSGPPLRVALEGQPFFVKLNHFEAGELAGISALAGDNAIDIGHALRARYGIDAVGISLGDKGTVLVSASDATHIRPPHVEVDSTVGAGDSFVAALVIALEAGRPLADACRYGVAAAASAVTTPASELCRKAQTDQIYEAISAGAEL